MTGRFEGRVAVVTGGASGIGDALVRLLVRDGGRVVVVDRQAERAVALAAELGDAAVAVTADVGVEADVARAVDTAVERFGRLDIMCNNAGFAGPDRPIAESDLDEYDAVMAVLLRGVFAGIKHAARVMIAQGEGGAIVNTSSIAGVRGGLGCHVYTTAKHGVIGLTRSAASELGRHRIRVNCVAPGGVPTPMGALFVTGDPTMTDYVAARQAERSPLGRAATPGDIAEAIAYLASDAGSFVHGQTLVVDAGSIIAPPRTPANGVPPDPQGDRP